MTLLSVTGLREAPLPAVGELPLRVYESTLCISFPVACAEERILMDPSETKLDVLFEDTLSDAASLVKRESNGGYLIVTLDTPRKIQRINVSVSTLLTVGFHRVDGTSIAPTPTVTAGMNQDLPMDFTAATFALSFTRTSDSSPFTIKPDQLTELWLQSFPAGPRLGVRDAEGAQAVFFRRVPGEICGDDGKSHCVILDAGQDLAAQLQLMLDAKLGKALAGALPSSIDIDVVVQSDAPADVTFTQCRVVAHRVRKGWAADPREKAVFRFGGKGNDACAAHLVLPGGARVIEGKLNILQSLGKVCAPIDGDWSGRDTDLAQNEGILVDPDAWAAQPLAVTDSAFTGICCALMALANDSVLLVTVRADNNGQPTGATLAAGRIALRSAGTRLWASILFDLPVSASKAVWALMRAGSGSAVWLAESRPNEAGVTIVSADTEGTVRRSRLDGLRALYRLLVSAPPTQEPPRSVLSVSVGDRPVGEAEKPGSFDLAPALNDFLADRTGSIDVPVFFSSPLTGIVTAYGPSLIFDA